jgi:hypothetical protein
MIYDSSYVFTHAEKVELYGWNLRWKIYLLSCQTSVPNSSFILCRIRGSHSGGYEKFHFLGYGTL